MSTQLSQSDTTDDKPEETYLPGYDDPDADMILRAKDGTRLLVHSYYLKATR